MSWTDEPRFGVGWAVTATLAVALLYLMYTSKAVVPPTLFSTDINRERADIMKCLQSPNGSRLLGTLSNIPVGNPLFAPRLARRTYFYRSSEGYEIILREEGHGTAIRVRGSKALTPSQAALFRNCSNPSAMW